MMETEQSKREEEAAWVTRCLAGERDAFEPLVRRYQQHIYRLANRILGCRESALDITQDTLVKAYNNLAGFKPDQSFRNWVLTIATHLCFDSLRRNRSFLNYFREKSGMIREQLITRGADEQNLESSPIFPVLTHHLNKKERLVLLLKSEEELNLKDIAEILGCRHSTARVHLFNARNKIRKILTGPDREGERP